MAEILICLTSALKYINHIYMYKGYDTKIRITDIFVSADSKKYAAHNI
jgi:hypothetical protein